MTGTQASSEPSKISSGPIAPYHLPWIKWLWGINILFFICTYYYTAQWRGELLFRPFTLGSENNVGAWWSGMQLLTTSLLLYSLTLVAAQAHRPLYWPLLALSALIAGMYVDEVGSLHERVSLWFGNRALIPFAVAGVAALGYGLRGLYQHRDMTGRGWLFILAGFAMFGSIVVQEYLEHNVDWPKWIMPARMVVEEGSEVLGFFFLLVGALHMRGRMGLCPGERDVLTPRLLPAPAALGTFMFVGTTLALPVIILRAPFSEELLEVPHYGDYGYAIPAMAMILPAFGAARMALIDRAMRFRWGWLAGTLCVASIDMCAHMYRYPLRLLGEEGDEGWRGQMVSFAHAMWRNDVGVLWLTPLVLAAVLAVPALRSGQVVAAGIGLMALAAASVAVSQPHLILAVCYLATLICGTWLLQRLHRIERGLSVN